jgi:hypothetical protein
LDKSNAKFKGPQEKVHLYKVMRMAYGAEFFLGRYLRGAFFPAKNPAINIDSSANMLRP